MKEIILLFRSKERKRCSIENMFKNVERYIGKEYKIKEEYDPEKKYFSIPKFFNIVKFVRKLDADIIHVTGEIYFCAMFTGHKRTILTIHDYVSLENMKGISKFICWLLMFYLPIKSSRFVTCNSPKTYDDTIKKFPWCKNKLYMIPVSISDEFQYNKKNFSKQHPKILMLGTNFNKNIEREVQALKDIKCTAIIIGHLSESQKEALKHTGIEYENYYDLSNSEILEQYINCDIVLFASTYEGFGMPVIEGQAVGRCIVTSNIEPMLTISGGAAIFVNPYDVNSIKEGIERAINDDKYRENLIKMGLSNCTKYRNEIVAKKYCELYREIENEKN